MCSTHVIMVHIVLFSCACIEKKRSKVGKSLFKNKVSSRDGEKNYAVLCTYSNNMADLETFIYLEHFIKHKYLFSEGCITKVFGNFYHNDWCFPLEKYFFILQSTKNWMKKQHKGNTKSQIFPLEKTCISCQILCFFYIVVNVHIKHYILLCEYWI